MPKTVQNVPSGYDKANPDKKVFKVPKGLKTLLEDMACEVFRLQPDPDKLLDFLADFCESRLNGTRMKYQPKIVVELPPGPKGEAIEAQRNKSILQAVASFDFTKMVNPEVALADDFKKKPKEPNSKGYTPNIATIDKQRESLGISKVEFGKGVPTGLSPSKAALFEKVDLAIMQGLELVDYLEKALENYKKDPYPKGARNAKADKAALEILRNRPSRREITDHVDVALANAFKLRDGIDSILRDHSGDGPNAQDFEAEQRELLQQRQNGTFPLVPTSTVAMLRHPSKVEVSEALVARVDKLNTIVARALELVEQLDKMDLADEPEKDEVEFLMQYGGEPVGEGSKTESEAVLTDLTRSQAALLQRSANDAVELLQNGGQPTPSQIQLLQSRGLITPSQAQILLAGGKLTPSQLKLLADKNLADAQAAMDAELETQKAVDEALALLQAGGTLSPSQIKLLADRNLLTESKAQVLSDGGALSPSTIQAIVDQNEAGDGVTESGEPENVDQAVFDAVELLKNGGTLTPSQVQLLAAQGLITPSKAQVLSDGGNLSPSQVQVIVNRNDAAIEEAMARAAQEALETLKSGGTLTPSQAQLLADRNMITESKAQILASGGMLSPSTIQAIANKDEAPTPRSASEPTPSQAAVVASPPPPPAEPAPIVPQISPSQARLQKENDALDLIKNGGHPTHSQIQVLSESGKISPAQALALAQGGAVDLNATESHEKVASKAPEAKPSTVESTTRANPPEEWTMDRTFVQDQIRIMRGLLDGSIGMNEAPVQTAVLTFAFILGVIASYQAFRAMFGRNQMSELPEDALVEDPMEFTKKCKL